MSFNLENIMTTLNTNNDVATFLTAAGQKTNTSVINNWATDPQVILYASLVDEEFAELSNAYRELDIVEVADAIGDLIWVLQGLALSIGIPQQAVWDEIARSNLAKIDPETGTVLKREDGKVLKPDDWTEPDIETILSQKG